LSTSLLPNIDDGSSDIPPPAITIKQGWMLRKEGLLRKWRKYYAVLEKGMKPLILYAINSFYAYIGYPHYKEYSSSTASLWTCIPSETASCPSAISVGTTSPHTMR
jgi:hypothetical protein